MNVVRLLLCIAMAAAVSASPVCVAQAPAAGQQPGSDITPTPEQSQSPWGWLKMPTITMPKISMPKMPADSMGEDCTQPPCKFRRACTAKLLEALMCFQHCLLREIGGIDFAL